MDRSAFFYDIFIKAFGLEPTSCQDRLFRRIAEFLSSDDSDVLLVNGYAGTGKTTALGAVVNALAAQRIKTELLAPTGRASKVQEQLSGRPSHTIHKHIFRQNTVGSDGHASFSLSPNKAKNTLFVVDEVSLIGDGSSQDNTVKFGSGNLLDDLIKFVRSGIDCKLILAGDSAQLPPVGMDNSPALGEDAMDSAFGGVSSVTLSGVVRQARQSGILTNATIVREKIVDGDISPLKLNITGFEDIERVGGAELIEKISDAYSSFGEDETVVLCRSNKRANRYNNGIRSTVLFKEEQLGRGDRLMIVKNCYQFLENVPEIDFIANGDIARLENIRHYEERYGLHFADAVLSFPDYGDVEINAKVLLDTLQSESASLSPVQQDALYAGVSADYADRGSRRKVWEAVREDSYFNALQLKYSQAITCHKSQGGQWKCVFIDCPFWQEETSIEDLKWLYTALTRAVEKVYLVNFPDRFFV